MTALQLIAFGVTCALVARVLDQVVIPWAKHRLRPQPERQVECSCGKQVPISKAHLVATTFADAEEQAMGGATAVVAEFCATHCPGTGCNKPKEHR